ncbi:MAG TPA: hypothetical protein VFK39_03040 [Gemmatimonadaceae bacterium]|nr:hypothetical protein [Gemmatimonadaceae bacterium]
MAHKEHDSGLSRSTLSAKWIDSPSQHEDRHGETLATRSHDVIRHWAEERKASPATVEGTEHHGEPGVLRFDFGGHDDSRLKHVDWDQWFAPFDERDLVFVFQEHRADGSQSNFFHLDNPNREHS